MDETKRSVDQLEARNRPRKERPLPDFALHTQRHNLAHFEQQAARLDREIASLHASQHRRASHLAAHRAERTELDAISAVLDDRIRHATNRAVADPPRYITKTLGPRPAGTIEDRAWVRAVVAIERYRLEHGITDQRSTLGPEPSNYADARDWDRVNDIVLDARDTIAPPPPTIIRQTPSLRGPSLDIDL